MIKRQNNTSAIKIFQVLDVLFLNFATGFTQTEIKEKTGLETTAVHRYVNTLIDVGYAEEIQGTKRYRPSHRFAQKSVQVMRSLDELSRSTTESLDRLTRG